MATNETKNVVYNLKVNTGNADSELNSLNQEVDELESGISKVAIQSTNMKDSLELGNAVLGGFQAANGLVAALNIENEELQKTLLRVLSVQQAIEGTTRIINVLTTENVALQKIRIVVQKAWNAVQQASLATQTALIGGLGLLAAGIVYAVNKYKEYTKAQEEASRWESQFRAQLQKTEKALREKARALELQGIENQIALLEKQGAAESKVAELQATLAEKRQIFAAKDIEDVDELINKRKANIAQLDEVIKKNEEEAKAQGLSVEATKQRLRTLEATKTAELTVLTDLQLRRGELEAVITENIIVENDKRVEDTKKTAEEEIKNYEASYQELQDLKIANLENEREAEDERLALDFDRERERIISETWGNFELQQELLAELTKQEDKQREAIRKRRAKEDEDEAKAEVDRNKRRIEQELRDEMELTTKKIQIAQNYGSAIVDLAYFISDTNEETANHLKQLALFQIAIDQAAAIANAIKQLRGLTGIDLAAQIAAVTLTVTRAFSQIKQTVDGLGDAPARGGSSGAGSYYQNSTFLGGGSAFNLIGQETGEGGNGSGNFAGRIDEEGARVYVVESDITDAQNRVKFAESVATVG